MDINTVQEPEVARVQVHTGEGFHCVVALLTHDFLFMYLLMNSVKLASYLSLHTQELCMNNTCLCYTAGTCTRQEYGMVKLVWLKITMLNKYNFQH